MNYLIKNKAWKINIEYNKEKLLYLLIDRPTQITSLGSFVWENKEGKKRRNYDFPLTVTKCGTISWIKRKLRYSRNNIINNPVIIWFDGHKEF